MDIITDHMAVAFWASAAVVFLALEALAISGIGFLFAGIAALTLGFLVAFGVAPAEKPLTQLCYFLFLTGIWAAALWAPMRKITRRSKSESPYNNFEGAARVEGAPLRKGEYGAIRWSGADMRARLDASETGDEIEAGAEVSIVRVEGNVAFVRRHNT